MTILKVDYITPGNRTDPEWVPVTELKQQVVKTYRNVYRGGSYTPSTTYGWLTAGYADYTPARADTRIRFSINISYAHSNGHSISHLIFYANAGTGATTERGRHSLSGQSPEHRHLYVWDFPSWGTVLGRAGYQVRNYGTSNQGRFNGTHHWDGGGSDQAAQTEIVIEEYLPI